MPRCIGPSRSAHTGIHRELPPAETDGFLWICGLVSGGLDWLHDSHPATEVNAAFDPGFLLSQKPRSRSQDMARRPGQRKRRSVAPPTRFCLPWSHLPQRFLRRQGAGAGARPWRWRPGFTEQCTETVMGFSRILRLENIVTTDEVLTEYVVFFRGKTQRLPSRA